jgi:hypothetical protein
VLHIVHNNDGVFSPTQLERKIREVGIFEDKFGKPKVGHSTLYHYRKVLEGLSFVKLEYGKYFISSDENTCNFLKSTSLQTPLNDKAKELLRIKIMNNKECKEKFFDLFMKKNDYYLNDFRTNGSTVGVRNLKQHPIISRKYNNPSDKPQKKPLKLVNAVELIPLYGIPKTIDDFDSLQAIFWGVRLWALELDLINEVFSFQYKNRVMYATNPDVSKETLFSYLLKNVYTNESSNWIEVYMPTYIETTCLETRVPVRTLHDFLESMINRNNAEISLVSVTMNVMKSQSPYGGMDETFLHLYPYINRIGHISHLRIRKEKVGGIIFE